MPPVEQSDEGSAEAANLEYAESRELSNVHPQHNQLALPPPDIDGETLPELSPPPAGNPGAPITWWEPMVAAPLRPSTVDIPIDVPTLMQLTAHYSARVQAVQQTPWILGTQVEFEKAAFDPALFADTNFDDTSDPVGNSLTTGGPTRLNEHDWSASTGIRRRALSGRLA